MLHEAEEQGLLLPWACRMGCCTSCAVRVLAGDLHQPQALGVSAGLRRQGYALMCVAYPRSDAVLEVVEVRTYDIFQRNEVAASKQSCVDCALKVSGFSDRRRPSMRGLGHVDPAQIPSLAGVQILHTERRTRPNGASPVCIRKKSYLATCS